MSIRFGFMKVVQSTEQMRNSTTILLLLWRELKIDFLAWPITLLHIFTYTFNPIHSQNHRTQCKQNNPVTGVCGQPDSLKKSNWIKNIFVWRAFHLFRYCTHSQSLSISLCLPLSVFCCLSQHLKTHWPPSTRYLVLNCVGLMIMLTVNVLILLSISYYLLLPLSCMLSHILSLLHSPISKWRLQMVQIFSHITKNSPEIIRLLERKHGSELWMWYEFLQYFSSHFYVILWDVKRS